MSDSKLRGWGWHPGLLLPGVLMLGLGVLGPARSWAGSPSPVEPTLATALEAVWQARTESERAAATDVVLAQEPTLQAVVEGLQARRYSPEVETGRMLRTRTGRFHYILHVPTTYDPERSYPVQVLLHGGVSRPARQRDGTWWQNDRQLANEDRLVVIPVGWDTAMWWQANQTENLAEILRSLRRTYNLDENRVVLFGISDGGSGAYFQAFRAPDPWASFVPLIGHPEVLANRAVGADGQMYVPNLSHRAILAINGGRDRLYPSRSVLPYVQLLRDVGVTIEFVDRPESGHSVGWLPEELPRILRFLRAHPRDPLPDRLTWETERTDRYHHFAWLTIEALGAVPGERPLDDPNQVTPLAPTPTLGITPDPASQDGVKLTEVRRGTVADAAGLRRGDRLVSVAGSPTPTLEALSAVLATHVAWGATLPVTAQRRGQTRDVTLEFPPPPAPPSARRAFPRDLPSGRVVANRQGNLFEVETRGVTRYSLWLSPTEVDFSQPVRVTTNGEASFAGTVEPDLRLLLDRAARDVDRTQLFAAKLTVDLRPKTP